MYMQSGKLWRQLSFFFEKKKDWSFDGSRRRYGMDKVLQNDDENGN